MTDVPIEPEALLRHSAWLRALALDLVGDVQRADDVVQETWLAALGRPLPARARPWLGAVARNAARMMLRGERRRARREELAAPREALPSTADSVARLALQREVAAAVLALDSPAREIVVLRYYDGLAPAEIARRLELSVTNVHTRLSRARAVLRARLAPSIEEERRAWNLVLASAGPGKLLGGVLMKTAGKWIAGALAVLLVALAVQRFVLRPSALEPRQDARELALAPPEQDVAPRELPARREAGELAREASVAEAAPAQEPDAPSVAPATTGSILVRVRRAEDGEPAPGIGLRVVPWDQPELWFHERSLVTDAEGLARFERVPPGLALVYISRLSEQDTFGSEQVVVIAGEEHTLGFQVVPGLTIEGRVVDFAGRAVAGASIWLGDGSGPPWGGEVVTSSDERGEFSLRHASTMQGIAARAEGYAPSRALLPRGGEEGGAVELELVLPALGGAIEGVVIDLEGRALADALVLVGDASFGRVKQAEGPPSWDPPLLRLRTDEHGRFVARGVAAGEVPVRARALGFAAGDALAQVPAGGVGEVRVVLAPGATVEGRVTRASGEPAPGAEVEANPVAGIDGMSRTRTVTDAAGRFELAGVALGELVLSAEAEGGGLSVETRLETRAGERAWWEAVLPETLPLAGRALDSSGEPLAGWLVRRELERPAPGHEAMARRGRTTDEEGRFRFEHFLVARHTLELHAPGQWLAEPVVALTGVLPGGPEPTLVAPAAAIPRGSLAGRVVDERGDPIAGARVGLGSRGAVFVVLEAEATADGRFALRYLPPQGYALTITADGAEALQETVEPLAEGEQRQLGDLALFPAKSHGE